MISSRRVNGTQYRSHTGAQGYQKFVIASITLAFASGKELLIQLSTSSFVSIFGLAKKNPSSLQLISMIGDNLL